MKITRFFSSLIITILLFSTFAISQNKSKLQPLAENASLEETQAWLKKAIKKFSPTDIYSLKFKGCNLKVDGMRMSHSVGRSGADSSTPVFIEGDFAYLSKTGLNSSAGSGYIFPGFFRYALDLKEMDAENILSKPARTEKEQTIYINTLEQRNTISYRRRGSGTFGKSFFQNSATFTGKKEFAEQIKTGLAKAIKLCSEAN